MKKIEDVCILVQARLGSQRVPNKMLRPFAGTTLTDILFKKLKSSKVIPKNNIYFSAWEQELKDVAKKHDINIYHRSEQSANEDNSLQLIYEWHDKLPFKYVILVSACNAVFEKKTYYWDKDGKSITDWKGATIMNTKVVEPIYEAAHCLYASRLDVVKDGYWMDTKSPPQPELFVMDEFEAFDIDYEWQFKLGEKIWE